MRPQNARRVIPKIIPLVAAVLLVGCGTAPPATQTVYVPVRTPCVRDEDMPARPAFAVEQLPTTATDGEKVLALARDWPSGRKYEEKLEAVLAGCR